MARQIKMKGASRCLPQFHIDQEIGGSILIEVT